MEEPTPFSQDDVGEDDSLDSKTFGKRKVTAERLSRMGRSGIYSRTKLFNELPEMKYEVTKINQYGKRQQRTLVLSNTGIENVRKNGKVSSIHSYDKVKKVQMKNLKTFLIKYEGSSHDYQYRSPVAMHILQEITSRLLIKIQPNMPYEERADIMKEHQEKLKRTGELDMSPILPPTDVIQSGCPRKLLQAKKLQSLLGVSEEQRLQTAIDSLVLDPSTAEGRALKQFCSNFGVLEQNPATLVLNIRQFIDDLRGYIMERHDEELSKLLIQASSKSTTPSDLSLSSVIEESLERVLLTRFKDRIFVCLKHPTREEDINLQYNIQRAKEKDQIFFGIKPDLVSPSNWASAIYELKKINCLEIPCRQLQAILSTTKIIYASRNQEKNKDNTTQMKDNFLTADDFFPIFLYVVIHSDIVEPLLLAESLWNLCDPEQLNGEAGYYLTVFCSALEYLKNTFASEIEGDSNGDAQYKILQKSESLPIIRGKDSTRRNVSKNNTDPTLSPNEASSCSTSSSLSSPQSFTSVTPSPPSPPFHTGVKLTTEMRRVASHSNFSGELDHNYRHSQRETRSDITGGGYTSSRESSRYDRTNSMLKLGLAATKRTFGDKLKRSIGRPRNDPQEGEGIDSERGEEALASIVKLDEEAPNPAGSPSSSTLPPLLNEDNSSSKQSENRDSEAVWRTSKPSGSALNPVLTGVGQRHRQDPDM